MRRSRGVQERAHRLDRDDVVSHGGHFHRWLPPPRTFALEILHRRLPVQPVELAVFQELRRPACFGGFPGTVEDHQLPEPIDVLARGFRVERTDGGHQPFGLVFCLLEHAQEPLVVGIETLVAREDEAPPKSTSLLIAVPRRYGFSCRTPSVAYQCQAST